MTNGDPLYREIEASFVRRIESGELAPGERLPTHRELADRLGVALGTVTRAYRELEAKGWVRGEVGRGTFVRGGLPEYTPFAIDGGDGEVVNLGPSLPPPVPEAADLAGTLAAIAGDPGVERLAEAAPHAGAARHRAAGAAWLARCGVPTDPERVIVCAGAQHAILVALAAIARPGDVVAAEALSFAAFRPLAATLGLRLAPVEIDAEGIVPEALEETCREAGPVALYLAAPTSHNPTTVATAEERRREIAEVLERHDVALIEDDPYRRYADATPAPVAWHLPERSAFVATWTKTVVAGLRIAWLHAPAAWTERLANAVRSTVFHVPPLAAEVAARWIADGTAERIVEARRAEMDARRAIAGELLGSRAAVGAGLHAWVRVGEGRSAREVVATARQRGVVALPAEVFAVEGSPTVQAVRVALGTPRSRPALERGLRAVAETLGAP